MSDNNSNSNSGGFGIIGKFLAILSGLAVLAAVIVLILYFAGVFKDDSKKKCSDKDLKGQCQSATSSSTKKDAKCDKETGAKTCDAGYCYLKDPMKVNCPANAISTCSNSDGTFSCKCGSDSYVQITNASDNTANLASVTCAANGTNGPFLYKCGTKEIPDGFVNNCKAMGGTPTCKADGTFVCDCKGTAGPLFVRGAGTLSAVCDAASGTTGVWSSFKCNNNAFTNDDLKCVANSYNMCDSDDTKPSCVCKASGQAAAADGTFTFQSMPSSCIENTVATCNADGISGWTCECGSVKSTDPTASCPENATKFCVKRSDNTYAWDCKCGSSDYLSEEDDCDSGEVHLCTKGQNTFNCGTAPASS